MITIGQTEEKTANTNPRKSDIKVTSNAVSAD